MYSYFFNDMADVCPLSFRKIPLLKRIMNDKILGYVGNVIVVQDLHETLGIGMFVTWNE